MYYLGYVFNYVFLDVRISPTPQQEQNSNNYARALMSAIPRAITPNPHTNLLNVYIYIYIQIANKKGFKPKKNMPICTLCTCDHHSWRTSNEIRTNVFIAIFKNDG
jgi:hypothetical protein